MIVLGLTGSIGMGKSTTAAMFARSGVPVYNADDAVHALYRGPAVAAVEAAFPGTTRDGIVDRAALSAALVGRPEAIARLEALIHPMVREAELAFRRKALASGASIALVDIPLLFETGGDARVDAVVVVTAAAAIQRARVLARPDMSEAKLATILARQLPDADKRRRAHFVVDTGRGLASAEAQVGGILRAVAGMLGKPARSDL